MNPSNIDNESATRSLSQSSSNIQVDEGENSFCRCGQHYFLMVVEKLFIVCGTFAISFFLFGILSLQNGGRHGDTFFLIGAGFIIILGIYMANQRHRIERLRALHGAAQTDLQNEAGRAIQIPTDNVYVVPLRLPTERTDSSQHLISPTSIFRSPREGDKPVDDPPKYEDVVSAPPSYESLNPATLRS